VGLDILFYYWNSMFEDGRIAQELVNRFFAIATSAERAATIGQIARAFRKTELTDENQEMLTKVQNLWEPRLEQIMEQVAAESLPKEQADEELNAFIDWLGCDCFHFDWRIEHITFALENISSDLQAFSATDDLTKISTDPAKLCTCLKLLKLLLEKSSGHNSLWQFETDSVVTMVKNGLQSGETDTITAAEEAQDALLRKELFRFLDL
jgi:hypothetical protein